MKLPRLRTVLLAPLVVFALLYVAAAVKFAGSDNRVAAIEGPQANYEMVALFGASGTAGDGILKAALANPDIELISTIGAGLMITGYLPWGLKEIKTT